MSINDKFNKFIADNLTLSQKDIEASSKSCKWVIDRVIAKIKEKNDYPQLFAINGQEYIHFGSYFKGTKVSNVDEFDVMMIIDSNDGVYKIDGKKIGSGVGNIYPNPKYSSKMKKTDNSGVDPQKLLNWLKRCIDEALAPYGCESSVKDGQAITIYLRSKDYSLDFVPGGIFTKEITGERFFIIPDNKGWIQTEPTVDKEYIKEIAKVFTQFKNAIRLMKYVRDNYEVDLSSYAIECAMVHFVLKAKKFSDDFEYDFIGFIYHLIDLVINKNVPDMRDSSVNTIKGIKYDEVTNDLSKVASRYNSIDKQSAYYDYHLERLLKNEWD